MRKKISKFGILWVLLLAVTGCVTTPRQMMADKLVDELCAKDGGGKVYETVIVPKNSFNERGDFTGLRFGKDTQPISDYYMVFEKNYISPYTSGEVGGLSVIRHITKVYRQKDNKLLGEQYIYERGGGDVFAIDASSSHSCKQGWTGGEIQEQIFLKAAN
jgi:hypothetical protein